MKSDVYETAFKAVQAAAEAYRLGEPGNRQLLKFAAIQALDCRVEEAEQRDLGAIIDLIRTARRILEVNGKAVYSELTKEQLMALIEASKTVEAEAPKGFNQPAQLENGTTS
jgi:sirohydrochlorin ferrochelatase